MYTHLSPRGCARAAAFKGPRAQPPGCPLQCPRGHGLFSVLGTNLHLHGSGAWCVGAACALCRRSAAARCSHWLIPPGSSKAVIVAHGAKAKHKYVAMAVAMHDNRGRGQTGACRSTHVPICPEGPTHTVQGRTARHRIASWPPGPFCFTTISGVKKRCPAGGAGEDCHLGERGWADAPAH